MILYYVVWCVITQNSSAVAGRATHQSLISSEAFCSWYTVTQCFILFLFFFLHKSSQGAVFRISPNYTSACSPAFHFPECTLSWISSEKVKEALSLPIIFCELKRPVNSSCFSGCGRLCLTLLSSKRAAGLCCHLLAASKTAPLCFSGSAAFSLTPVFRVWPVTLQYRSEVTPQERRTPLLPDVVIRPLTAGPLSQPPPNL